MKIKKSFLRRIVGIVGYTLIFVISALLVFVLISNLHGNVTFLGKHTIIWVKTGSMEKTIPERSYILVKKASADEISTGDIIVFYSDDPTLGGALNTHRVVEIIGDHEEFVTAGDNNPTQDQYTAKADKIVAVYQKNLPVLSAIGRFLSTSIGHVVTIALILAVFMIIYVPDIIKATRRIDKQLEEDKKTRFDELIKAEVEKLKLEAAKKESADLHTAGTEEIKQSPEDPEQDAANKDTD